MRRLECGVAAPLRGPCPETPCTCLPLPPRLSSPCPSAPALPRRPCLATCESGPKSGWQPAEKLEKQLADQGWKVRRIKEDGGCYEVYALDDKGQRVEAYFHPVTFAPVPTTRR